MKYGGDNFVFNTIIKIIVLKASQMEKFLKTSKLLFISINFMNLL